jgi:serine/threonine protein kinase
LHHPNLAQHYELHLDDGDAFITMELVEGRDFVEHVRRDLPADDRSRGAAGHAAPGRPGRDGRTDHFSACPDAGIARLRAVLPQLVASVAALHDAGLVHRDLQPANVQVTYDGRVVVLDYGLTSAASVDPNGADTGELVGTPIYVAPEQWDPSATGPASDWYSVGVIVFEALTGAPPFGGGAQEIFMRKRTVSAPRPSQVVSPIPEDLDQLVGELLRMDPGQRPTGAALSARFPLAAR